MTQSIEKNAFQKAEKLAGYILRMHEEYPNVVSEKSLHQSIIITQMSLEILSQWDSSGENIEAMKKNAIDTVRRCNTGGSA